MILITVHSIQVKQSQDAAIRDVGSLERLLYTKCNRTLISIIGDTCESPAIYINMAAVEKVSSPHLSEGMPSVLLLCLLCMAYCSSPHGPALQIEINNRVRLTERPACSLYPQLFLFVCASYIT